MRQCSCSSEGGLKRCMFDECAGDIEIKFHVDNGFSEIDHATRST